VRAITVTAILEAGQATQPIELINEDTVADCRPPYGGPLGVQHPKDFSVGWKKALRAFGRKLKKALLLACFPFILSCSHSTSPNDVLGIAVQNLFEWIDTLPISLYLTPVRLTVIFGLVTLSSAFTFLQMGSRLSHWQIGLAIFAAFVGVSLPIHVLVPSNLWLRGWLFILSLILTFVLSFTFPFFLAAQEGHQKWIYRGCLIFIALTFLLTLFRL